MRHTASSRLLATNNTLPPTQFSSRSLHPRHVPSPPPSFSPKAIAGLYLLASEDMEEALYVAVNRSHVYVDTRSTSQDNNTFQPSFRTILPAPFPEPDDGVVKLRVFLDQTVVEVFASDNTRGVAVAITALGFPLRARATRSGVFASCSPNDLRTDGGVRDGDERWSGVDVGSSQVMVNATVWPIAAFPVRCTPPTCTPPAPFNAA